MKKKIKAFFTQLISNNQGFSLAEVMVAAGMLGVLSLGVSQLMQNSAKTEKRLGQQVNLLSLEAEIQSALSNPLSCGRTFGAMDGNVNTPAANSAIITASWRDLPIYKDGREHIFGSSNPTLMFPDADDWPLTITQYDGNQDANGKYYGVYGDGSNTVTVTNIQYRGYYGPGNTGSMNNADYNVANASPIVNANPSAQIAQVVIRVEFTRGNYSQFEGMGSEEERKRASAIRSYGSYRITRFYKVRVRVRTENPGNNRVERCLTSENDQIADFCGSIGGYFDQADNTCKNIKVYDGNTTKGSNTGEDNRYSIAAKMNGAVDGGSIIAENHMVVGFADSDATVYSEDNARRGDIIASRDGDFRRNVLAGESVTAGTFLDVGTYANIGPWADADQTTTSGDLYIFRDLNVRENALVQRRLTVGLSAANTTRNLTVSGDNLRFQNAADNLNIEMFKDSGQTLQVNGIESEFLNGNRILGVHKEEDGTNYPLHLRSGTGTNSNKFKLRPSGEIEILYNNSPVLQIGANSGDYRPIYIHNQSIDTSTYTFATLSSESREVPTKEWVRKMVFGEFYDDPSIVAAVINNMKDYLQHKQADAVLGTVCNSIQLRTGFNAQTKYSSCVFDTGIQKCRCQTSNCSSTEDGNVGQAVCGGITSLDYIVASSYMRAPAIYTTATGVANPGAGNMRAVNIYATNDMVASGNIQANNNITSLSGNIVADNGNVLAVNGRVEGARVVGSQVCHTGTSGNRYCYTKFGKFGCTNYGYMIGIAYGVPICANNFGTATTWEEH